MEEEQEEDTQMVCNNFIKWYNISKTIKIWLTNAMHEYLGWKCCWLHFGIMILLILELGHGLDLQIMLITLTQW